MTPGDDPNGRLLPGAQHYSTFSPCLNSTSHAIRDLLSRSTGDMSLDSRGYDPGIQLRNTSVAFGLFEAPASSTWSRGLGHLTWIPVSSDTS